MNENACQPLTSPPLTENEPAPGTLPVASPPYHGRNKKMKRATALAPATISPKLTFEVSNWVLSVGGLTRLPAAPLYPALPDGPITRGTRPDGPQRTGRG